MENNVDTMLPCIALIQKIEPKTIKVATVNLMKLMQVIKNPKIGSITN